MLLVAPRYEPGKAPQQDLDLEVVLGYLRRSGFCVQAVNAQLACLEPSALAALVCGSGAEVVYWHLRRRPDLHALEAVVPWLRSLSPGPLMLAGGDLPGRYDLRVLERVKALHGVIRGEPELSLAALGESFSQAGSWWKEPGISYRESGTGAGIRNPARPLLEDLDHLPMAADDLFEPGRLERGQQVLFARGCNNDCRYCGFQTPYREEFPGRGKFWRSRSAVTIVNEIEHYYREKGVARFTFNSFVLFGYGAVGGERVADVAREILRRRLDITFSFVTHPGPLRQNRAILPLLQEAGLAQVILGVDSGLSRVLQLYGVPFSREDIFEALHALHQTRTNFVPAFVFFDPYLTLEEIRANLQFLEEIQPFFEHLELPYSHYLDRHILRTALKVRPEMPLYRRLVEDGLATEVDPLEADPVVRFQSPATGKVFQAQGRVRRITGRELRSCLGSRKAVGQVPAGNRLPIELLRKIVDIVERRPELDVKGVAQEAVSWVQGRLAGNVVASPARPERERPEGA